MSPTAPEGTSWRFCEVCGGFDTTARNVIYAPGVPQAVPSQEMLGKMYAAARATDAEDAEVAVAMELAMEPNSIVVHLDCESPIELMSAEEVAAANQAQEEPAVLKGA